MLCKVSLELVTCMLLFFDCGIYTKCQKDNSKVHVVTEQFADKPFFRLVNLFQMFTQKLTENWDKMLAVNTF